MKTICINSIPGFSEWRDAAREALLSYTAPQDILWQDFDSPSLFSGLIPIIQPASKSRPTHHAIHVPSEFLDLAETVICHTDAKKYALLYRVLWRLIHENRQLLHYQTDDDILQLNAMVKAVRRDAYKIKAFLRFRETICEDGNPYFVAWYESEHYILERALPFFTTRFANMRWSILTPYKAAHWDGNALTLSDNPNPHLKPLEDDIEQYWLTYYANVFNPARIKVKAMLNQMPKKYWHNMPETALISDLLQNAPKRLQTMLAQQIETNR